MGESYMVECDGCGEEVPYERTTYFPWGSYLCEKCVLVRGLFIVKDFLGSISGKEEREYWGV